MAIEKKRAYIEDRHMAEDTAPTYATIRYISKNCRTRTMMVEATSSLRRTLSLFSTGPVQ